MLNAIAPMDQLQVIRTEARSVLSAVDFNDGLTLVGFVALAAAVRRFFARRSSVAPEEQM